MLDKSEAEALLVSRIIVAGDSCNAYHRNHCEGQVRALVAVLTGDVPPISDYPETFLDACQIPYTRSAEGILIDEGWLADHGFHYDSSSDRWRHLRFGAW